MALPAATAHFRLDDCAASTTIVDANNAYNGTFSQNTLNPAGRQGFSTLHPCLFFRSSLSDVCTLTSVTQLSAKNQTAMSISAWVRPEALPAANSAIWHESTNSAGQNSRLALYMNSSGQPKCAVRCGDAATVEVITAAGAMTLDSAYFLVVTVNTVTDNLYLYVNGVAEPVSTTAKATFTNSNPNLMCIGYLGSAGTYFQGKIWNLKVYVGTELTAAQVTEAYNSGAGVAEDYTYANISALGYPATTNTMTGVSYANGVYSGTVSLPAITNVRNTITYGASGALTGTMTLPSVGNVLESIQYGANGTEFTGTRADKRYFKAP